MKVRVLQMLSGLVWLVVSSCVKPFSPPEITQAGRYLVVDGFLNAGNTPSTIRLSRTQNLSESSFVQFQETGALVSVEGDKGSLFAFAETGSGSYTMGQGQISALEKFRIRIKTKDGKEYLSDYTPVKISPAIDSLTYEVYGDREGVRINVNTHDPLNNTRFYRWEYEETWEYTAGQHSEYEVLNKDKPIGERSIIRRRDNIYNCWQSAYPTNIIVGSTIKLTQDVVRNARVVTVPTATNKLFVKYSVLVKQYALTQEAYEYWLALGKTTETTGSIFDPVPSQITGNIRCLSDDREPVFGFFSAGLVQEKRIFITPNLGVYPSCAVVDTLKLEDALKAVGLIVELVRKEGILQYSTTTVPCADCRSRGGVNVRPLFWE